MLSCGGGGGRLWGALLAQRLTAETLKKTFAVFFIILGLYMIFGRAARVNKAPLVDITDTMQGTAVARERR